MPQWWEPGGVFWVCLKAEPRRQVYDFYLYLARLTQKSTSPELQVASATAWTQAISGLTQGLWLEVVAICWHPESSRYWEVKLLYFVRKHDSLFSLQKTAALTRYFPLSIPTVQCWALGGTSAWLLPISQWLRHLASEGEKLCLHGCYSTTSYMHHTTVLLFAVGILYKPVLTVPCCKGREVEGRENSSGLNAMFYINSWRRNNWQTANFLWLNKENGSSTEVAYCIWQIPWSKKSCLLSTWLKQLALNAAIFDPPPCTLFLTPWRSHLMFAAFPGALCA